MIPSSSNKYSFTKTILEQILVDAYERVGIAPEAITAQHIESAKRSANLLLSEWVNKGLNLWSISPEMLGLTSLQRTYKLPIPTSDVKEVLLRTSTRQLNGTPGSSTGGIAQNAFDGKTETSCQQLAANGNISYDYGENSTPMITLVGIQSAVEAKYTLSFEKSDDGVTWNTVCSFDQEVYPRQKIVWKVVPVMVSGRAFRVRETGNAILNISELYFNNNIQDTPLARLSRSEYAVIPQKEQLGRPTSYWINRQLEPEITLWPVPTDQYKALYFTRVRMLQDVGEMYNLTDTPQRFFEALTAGLAFKLSVKYDPQRSSLLKALYDESFEVAAAEDSESTPLRIGTDQLSYWTLQ